MDLSNEQEVQEKRSEDWLDDGPSDEQLILAAEEAEQEAAKGFHFELIPHVDRRARKFGLHRRVFTTRLVQQGGHRGAISRATLPQLVESALQRAITERVLDSNVRDDDFLMVNMSSNRLRHAHQSHRVRVRDWRNNTKPAQVLLDQLSKILNSNEQFRLDDSFHIEVTHVRDPGRGSGKNRSKLGSQRIDEMLRLKKSVVTINNKDELCCARALVTAQAYHQYGAKHNLYLDIRKGRHEQEKRAKALHAEARVPEAPCGLEEIALFQIVLSDYQIVVVSVDQDYQITFKGPERDKQLVLIQMEEHYDACTSLSGFFGKVYYCVECEKGFSNNDLKHHRCPGKKCFACHQANCPDFNQRDEGEVAHLPCHRCHRFFFGPICQTNHLLHRSEGSWADPAKKNSVCETHRKCNDCQKVLTSKEIKHHKCGWAHCPCCKEYKNLAQHQCFLQPVPLVEDLPKKKQRGQKRKRGAAAGLATVQANDPTFRVETTEEELPPLFVYFDIEARQDQGEHVANLLCAELEDSDECQVFQGESCIEAMLDWVRQLTNPNDPDNRREVIVVAHNFQGYDSYFVLDELYKQRICPKQIVNGAKILCMEIEGPIKFIDSMCFLQMALSDFTKAFGLTELKKGFFPHFFNTPDNQAYVGEIPAMDYYDPDSMSPERREEFMAWHTARREEGYVFDFAQELVDYCKSDVRLLKQGCMKFQQEFHKVAKFNPMAKCITIASACSRYYRKMCLPEGTIASEPLRGWHGAAKPHSHVSMEWLHWLNHQLRQQPTTSTTTDQDRIAHACNRGEHPLRIGCKVIHVDGYDETTGTVYEFHGCFYHSCPQCFPHQNMKHPKHADKTMREVYQETKEREKAIRDAGYHLEAIWECEWNTQKKTSPDIRDFLHHLQLVPRLNPRDAFFGGRTNAVQLYGKTQPEEEIHYVDFTSLYPWVNKNCDYPIGHPVIITQPSQDISEYFGLVHCTILPPYQLYHPVLPFRYEGKLTFPLCRTCVETQLKRSLLERSMDCPHSNDERALRGTWCTPEIQEALNQGYKIIKVHEVWNFPTKSNTLFSGYVNTFLKIKQEASGWPGDVEDDPDKREHYVRDYLEHEGIQLNVDHINHNPGKRQLAKMMLNSFWGKFGQQGNKYQVEAFTSPAKFYKLLQDDCQDIHAIRIVNEEMLEVVHNYRNECSPVQVNTNIFVACFTTCWARLRLYQQGLNKLEPEQTLYFDTDSIVYLWRPGLPKLPLGNYLGEFTNELEQGDHIVEFAAAGPKNYGYKTFQGKVECKVRGFSLNFRGQQQLNFDILRNNVKAELQDPVKDPRTLPVWNPHKIVRDNQTKRLTTQTEITRYQLVFDKRVVSPDSFKTYPYGYSKREEDDDDDDDDNPLNL